MSDLAVKPVDWDVRHAKWARKQGVLDAVFRGLTFAFAAFVLVLLGAIILTLVYGAWPALAKFGLGFVTSESWNPVTENFGARAPIYGTLVTSAIAMVIGIPISFGIAVFITELCPPWLKRPIGTAIELLAGIPSIIDRKSTRLNSSHSQQSRMPSSA